MIIQNKPGILAFTTKKIVCKTSVSTTIEPKVIWIKPMKRRFLIIKLLIPLKLFSTPYKPTERTVKFGNGLLSLHCFFW